MGTLCFLNFEIGQNWSNIASTPYLHSNLKYFLRTTRGQPNSPFKFPMKNLKNDSSLYAENRETPSYLTAENVDITTMYEMTYK